VTVSPDERAEAARPAETTTASRSGDGRAWPAPHGLRLRTAIALYLAVAAAPLGLAAVTGDWRREPVLDAVGSGLALVAFAIMLLEFTLSGRYRRVSGRIGFDRTMRFHRATAYVMTAMAALHPFFYSHPGAQAGPWFTGADPVLPVGLWSLATAIGAWLTITALVLAAIDRDLLPVRYEIWQRLHAGGAVAAAGFVAAHAVTSGGYSAQPFLIAYWSALIGVAVLTQLYVHGLRPWRQQRAPYVVDRVDKVGANTWEVRLRPRDGGGNQGAMRFRPGQFAWLKLGRRAFGASEHPFSMSTAPEDSPEIGFTIKETGDFTTGVGAWQPGTPAYLDGPHGHFVPDDTPVPTIYVAGGVGIGPVISHLRAFAARGDRRPITLIYGAATAEQIADRDELDALTRVLDLTVHYVLSDPDAAWDGLTGRITPDVLAHCLPADGRAAARYFVCGPDAMMTAVHHSLRELGVPERRIVTGS
jgi:predicted ferric reductase